jgi:hypothetical protein
MIVWVNQVQPSVSVQFAQLTTGVPAEETIEVLGDACISSSEDCFGYICVDHFKFGFTAPQIE